MDAPAGVTQEEGHTEVLHLSSAVLALIFIVESNYAYPPINRSPLAQPQKVSRLPTEPPGRPVRKTRAPLPDQPGLLGLL